jgi:IS1 family transposase
MDFMGAGCAAVLEPLQVQPVAASDEGLPGCLEVEADELWSVVPKKANPRRLWLAMDKQSRPIIAFPVGDRSRDSTKPLWATGPAVEREQTTFLYRSHAAYRGGIPAAPHQAITKHARTPNSSARFNNPLRHPGSRLGRSTLASSKRLEHHSGASRSFIDHDNLTRAAFLV